jgi:hypothetical protein
MEYKIRNLVLQEAPKFSEFLMDNFDGEISASEARKVKQGFNSERNNMETFFLGPERFRWRIDEDKFYKIQEEFPGIGRYFIGPFYDCLIKQISFMPPESKLEEIREGLKEFDFHGTKSKRNKEGIESAIKNFIGTLKGEFRVYPQFKDKETGNSPMIYNGFRPGVGHHNENGLDYISLQYGSYADLSELVDHFKNGFSKEKRGAFWKSEKYKRYDRHEDIPFP